MSATTVKTGFGGTLKRGDGAGPEVFTAIAELLDWDGPNFSQEVVDATHMASPGGFMERIASIKDAGEIKLVCHLLNDATQNLTAGILKDLSDGTKRNFKLEWPTTTAKTYAFAAFVTGFNPGAKVKEKMTVEIKLAITGQVTES